MQRILLNELHKQGHEVHIILPDIEPLYLCDMGCVRKHYVAMGHQKYHVRYFLDWQRVTAILKSESPDIIWNNQIELGATFKALLETINLPNIALVSYCHYLPFIFQGDDESPELDISQNDGNLCMPTSLNIVGSILASDMVLIQSEFARHQVLKKFNFLGLKCTTPIELLPPPLDPSFLRSDINNFDNEGVVYNHRLYKQYGTDEAIKLFLLISNSPNLKNIVSDPMPNRSKERATKDDSVTLYKQQIERLPNTELFSEGSDRKMYIKMLSMSFAGLCAPRKGAVWSMSALDLMAMGIPVIGKNIAAYPEILPPELLYSNNDQALEILKRLKSDFNFYTEMSRCSKLMAVKFTPSIVANVLNDLITNLLATKQSNLLASS